tara:strand:- start:61 stop:492 length:432 start_codon:yes stop_codon:yes gene_type:complete
VKSISKLGCIFCLLIISGCFGGDGEKIETAAFSGTVTLDGQPLEKGVIQFRPGKDASGQPLRGQITEAAINAGQYQLASDQGAVVGENSVVISATKVVGKEMADGVEIEKVEQYLPAKYNSETTLTITVTPEDTEHNFELSSK